MITDSITIVNKLGLHARAATKLAATCARFACTVQCGREGQLVDAKSIMSLMLLAAPQGSQLQFTFDGEDAEQAHSAVTALIADFFGEGG
ncbi:MAG: HPr family phosphocarrier protein [Porticoccaceae bacterium]